MRDNREIRIKKSFKPIAKKLRQKWEIKKKTIQKQKKPINKPVNSI